MKSTSLFPLSKIRIGIGLAIAVVLSLFLARFMNTGPEEATQNVPQSKTAVRTASAQRQDMDRQAKANKTAANPVEQSEFTGKAPAIPKLDDPKYAEYIQQRREDVERQRAELRKTHVPADTAANRAALQEGMDPLDLPDAQGNVPQIPGVIDKTLIDYIPDLPQAVEGQELTPAQQELAARIRKAREAKPSELPVIDQTPADPARIAIMEEQISTLAGQLGTQPDYRNQPEAYGAWLERRKAMIAAINQLAEFTHRPANTINNRRAIMAGVSPVELPASDGSGANTESDIIDQRLLNHEETIVVDAEEDPSRQSPTE